MGSINSKLLSNGKKEGRVWVTTPSPDMERSVSCPETVSVDNTVEVDEPKSSLFKKTRWQFCRFKKPLSKHWVAARASDYNNDSRSPSIVPAAYQAEDWASSNLSPNRSFASSDDSSIGNDPEMDAWRPHSHERRSMQFVSADDLFRPKTKPVKRRSSTSTLNESLGHDDHLSIIQENTSITHSKIPLERCEFALFKPETVLPAQQVSVPQLASASLFGGPPIVTPNIQWQTAHAPADMTLPKLSESPGISIAYVSGLLLHCMLGGEYMAPLRRPRTILDVCLRDCIWMQKMALSFPKCRIVGSSSVKYYIGAACTLPLNCQIVFQNSLDDLPIATDSIDYIHQQMKSFLLTKDGWARHLRNLRRVLRPGKYIELVEVDLLPSRAGPGSSRLVCMIQRLLQLRDIDPEMPRKLEPLLKQSGFKHVERLDVNVPIGEWGGPGGKLMLWLLDTVIFMIRQAVIDGINWDLFEGYNGSMVLDEMMPDTPICLNLMASAPDANYSNITANEFDALWDTTRREMTVNCSYSTMHVYLAK